MASGVASSVGGRRWTHRVAEAYWGYWWAQGVVGSLKASCGETWGVEGGLSEVIANIRPVFKSEDPTKFSNYRPISVLPVLSQVFERVLQVRRLEFLDLQGVINPGQYGFRAGHSTAMAVQDMVERVRGAWDSKRATLGVFIDLKKAFNTVDHGILLAKLEHYGVRGEVLGLLGSYLEGRFQNVVYNGVSRVGGRLGVGCPRVRFWGPCFSSSMSMTW
jgi:hypothetical protein